MRCSTFRKNIFLYLERKLNKVQEEKMNEHFKSCAWCAAEFKKSKKMINIINDTKPKMVPENLHKNIMVEVNGMRSFKEEEKRENKIAFRVAIKRAGVAFAAIFIVFVALEYINFDSFSSAGIKRWLSLDFGSKNSATETIEAALDTSGVMLLSDSLVGTEDTKEANAFDALTMFSAKGKSASDESINASRMTLASNAAEENATISLDETKKEKGFALNEDYSELLDSSDITKKSMIELYTSDFDESILKIEDAARKNYGEVYYENIEYNEEDSDIYSRDAREYRNAIVAIKVLESNYRSLKTEVEHLGKYDINVEQKENVIGINDNYEDLLAGCKEEKNKLEKDLEDLKANYNKLSSPSEKEKEDYQNEKAKLESNIETVNTSIKNLETTISTEDERMKTEVVKLEVNLKECSDLDIEGILGGKVFLRNIKKSFLRGCDSFVRTIQNAFLWVCENILYIILFVILFAIIFAMLKFFLLRNDE